MLGGWVGGWVAEHLVTRACQDTQHSLLRPQRSPHDGALPLVSSVEEGRGSVGGAGRQARGRRAASYAAVHRLCHATQPAAVVRVGGIEVVSKLMHPASGTEAVFVHLCVCVCVQHGCRCSRNRQACAAETHADRHGGWPCPQRLMHRQCAQTALTRQWRPTRRPQGWLPGPRSKQSSRAACLCREERAVHECAVFWRCSTGGTRCPSRHGQLPASNCAMAQLCHAVHALGV